MITIIKEVRRGIPGTWFGTVRDGKRIVYLTCRNGHTAELTNHVITATGEVLPSVVCPEDNCNYHEMVKLDGWAN